MVRGRLWLGLALAGMLALGQVLMAGAFAEEHVDFRDPATGEVVSGSEVSTVHFDLTYALALAAGFTVQDARTLQVYDQLVDSVVVGDAASGPYYSNLGGSFYSAPDPAVVCPPGTDASKVAWPLWGQVEDAQAVTSRYGPYMPFFHFPHKDGPEVQALHDWGWGLTNDLVGYEAYAWGAHSVLDADTCRHTTAPRKINTTMQAGTLAAFATYLHSLADSYSHDACIVELVDNRGLPWATHSQKLGLLPNIYPCDYNPSFPNNDDAHGREFGQVYPSDSARTDAGIQAVYTQLVLRGQTGEGRYAPLTMGAQLRFMDGNPTLQEALTRFVHGWEWNQAPARRAYTDDLVHALLAQRYGGLFIPLAVR